MTVLNINALANAVRPVVVAGEVIQVHVLKEGKELNQGVGYLDDGTMVIVEGGKSHVGTDNRCGRHADVEDERGDR